LEDVEDIREDLARVLAVVQALATPEIIENGSRGGKKSEEPRARPVTRARPLTMDRS